MSLTESMFTTWMRGYEDAWEKRDPEAVKAIFTADATYRETPFSEPMPGPGAIGEYWRQRAVEEQRNVDFSFTVLALEGDTGYAHWNSKFDALPFGKRVELDGIFRCSFRLSGPDNGKCYRLEEWWHLRELGPI